MHDQEKGQREGNPTSRHQQRIKGRPGGVFQSCLEQGVRELRGERTQELRRKDPGLAWTGEPEGRGASEKGTHEDPEGSLGSWKVSLQLCLRSCLGCQQEHSGSLSVEQEMSKTQ